MTVDPADVDAVAALDPPATSVRDVKTRLRWRSDRAAAALRAYRERRSPAVPQADPEASPEAPPAAADEPARPPAAPAPARAGGVRAALDVALDAGGHGPEHAAAVELARRYADRIDADPDALGKLGRPLLAALVELRLTPRTRTALLPIPTPPGDPHADESADDERVDELEQFRSRRDRRAYGTATVDPAAP